MIDVVLTFSLIYMVLYVASFVYAARHRDNPFWKSYLDGLSFRYILWDRSWMKKK